MSKPVRYEYIMPFPMERRRHCNWMLAHMLSLLLVFDAGMRTDLVPRKPAFFVNMVLPQYILFLGTAVNQRI